MLATMDELPSHADRQAFADSTQSLPGWAQLTVAEIEDMDEETFGVMLKYGTPAQAAAAMERRIALFKTHKGQVLSALEDDTTPADQIPLLEGDLSTLNQKLSTAEKRLADYRLQHEQRN